MPLNPSIKKILIIGSGAIVIGQAAEFDYAGSQACRALRALGLEVVLVNPNPATIMTDSVMADHIYIEPLTVPTLKRIIKKERPDSLLTTLGGQSGLTLSMKLAKDGFLGRMGVRLLGSSLDTIERAEDRQLFKDTMNEIGQPCIPSDVVTDVDAALSLADNLGYPVIVRPAFTLGGSGGGIAKDAAELAVTARGGIEASPIGQILVEKCVSGWKEIEFEVMRDKDDNAITVCSMENFDPVGVHTGDSIVIAPTVTLSDKEYQMLRTAAINIIKSLKVEGGCNVQFALHPTSFEYAVIEVNPRVSRSSALASKATGYPIAKIAAQLAVGFTLPELANMVTGSTSACFEPALDYVVVKLPKWPFDKFVYAKRTLGTQMKATGEVMAIGTSFEQALMKAVRGAEIGQDFIRIKKVEDVDTDALLLKMEECTDERLFIVAELLWRGVSVDEIHRRSMIDNWFLSKLVNLLDTERELRTLRKASDLPNDTYLHAKRLGFTDALIARLSGQTIANPRSPVYKMVDTCAAEFVAKTPYFYATYDDEDEAAELIERRDAARDTLSLPKRKKVIVFGSGPIRIGQGIEFDYACVHCVWTLRELGYEVILVNNNPETVSTDFDTADRLYFEPLTPEDAAGVIRVEKPFAAVCQFGGQTAIKLTKYLAKIGLPLLGTSAEGVDAAEDRERFDEILTRLGLARPKGATIMTREEALAAAETLGYPVLLRPSYVLGGQNMIIANSDTDVAEYMDIILAQGIENPVLIDQYLMGTEVEVDAICDGTDILIPGIMEHVERAGVHSGDSIAVYPAWNLNGVLTDKVIDATKNLAIALGTIGLINIQYIIHDNSVFIIEANPRASRTVPYISKVTGLPVVDVAVRCMLGEKLAAMEYGTGLFRKSAYFAVKVPAFSFEKLIDADTQLGPEMKSTGEVLGIARTLEEAMVKGLSAAGYHNEMRGGALFSVRAEDRAETVRTARLLSENGFRIYAAGGTAEAFRASGIYASKLPSVSLDIGKTFELIDSGKIQLIVSTSQKGRQPANANVRLRRKAVERGIPCFTSLDTALAFCRAIGSRYSLMNAELVDINAMRHDKQKLRFVKMRGSGNDYIYFDCYDQTVESPESVSVQVSSRRLGIGSDGIVLIGASTLPEADAAMRMFNADGSEAELAGNSLRCVAKYLYESGRVKKEAMTISTEGGLKRVRVFARGGMVEQVCVSMGRVSYEPKNVPVLLDEPAINKGITVGGRAVYITCLSMGNPHCVIFTDDVSAADVAGWGGKIEVDPLFPQRVNVSFAQSENKHTLRMRTWERGIGETMACGTGACAAAAAAVRLGYLEEGDQTVHMPGGDLLVTVEGDEISLTGDAVIDFFGEINL